MSALEIPEFNRLREIREARGMTRKQLSSASGVHEVCIRQIETWNRPLSGKTLIRLAIALQTDALVLLGISKKIP